MTTTLDINLDETKDEISFLLEKFRSTSGWTSDKVSQLKNLIQLLEQLGYEKFFLKENRYHVGKVGSAYQYKVSDKRRGLFAKFRAKSVRVICIESGRFDRTVMVKEITHHE
jgi:hypothetical protein